MTRRPFLIGAALAAALAATALPASAQPAAATVGAWAAGPVQGISLFGCPGGDGGLNDQTVRNIVYPSTDGSRVRVRLSNVFGTSNLVVGAASVAVESTGAAVTASTRHAVRFGGKRSVTIVPGSEALSDWIDMPVVAHRDLAVSVYVPKFDGPATEHPSSQQNNFLSKSGNWADSAASDGYPTGLPCWMFLDGLDVQPTSAATVGSVVAFGDSITDGVTAGTNANDRWPDDLGRRLYARSAKTLSVVDEGIGGNQILQDSGVDGVSALARFDRDALQQPGVRDVVLLEGVNDIGASDLGNRPHLAPADLVAAYRQLIARSHAAGVRIYGATLTPFKGAAFGYWNADGEHTREVVNHWILTSGEFDGVVDFAKAVSNPDDPTVYEPAYDSGDHVHPNEAGYRAMADAIDLSMLVRGATGPRPSAQHPEG